MGTVTKIMVAVDFSEHSVSAAQSAAGLASDLGAALVLISVINQRDIDTLEFAAKRVAIFSAKKYIEEQIESRQKLFTELQKKLNLDHLNVQTNVRKGVPYREILAAIEEHKPDLLVMGRRGNSDLADIIIGSCAQKLFRRCPIPLLSIRAKE